MQPAPLATSSDTAKTAPAGHQPRLLGRRACNEAIPTAAIGIGPTHHSMVVGSAIVLKAKWTSKIGQAITSDAKNRSDRTSLRDPSLRAKRSGLRKASPEIAAMPEAARQARR